MGEIANDMVEGRCCSICGQYFADPKKPEQVYEHGYPVACHDCYEPDCGYPDADVETL